MLKMAKTVLALLPLIGCLGCASYVPRDPAYFLGESSDVLRSLEAARAQEEKAPSEALRIYQDFLKGSAPLEPFPSYQEQLKKALDNKGKVQYGSASNFHGESRGFPVTYARWTQAFALAHQGSARVCLAQGTVESAERELLSAMEVIKRCEFCPHTSGESLTESYLILAKIRQTQGQIGKALVAQLSADLVRDHVRSERGVEEFYLEKSLLFGDVARKQFNETQRFYNAVNIGQAQEAQARFNAVATSVSMANAHIQGMAAQQALEKSGGIVTPEVQRAQISAQLARVSAQLNVISNEMHAGGQSKVEFMSTPWAIPTFTQQLVDPKQGANTPAIMKDFAASAAQAGGASYQAGAQQVNQAVDDLMPYRQSAKMDGAVPQVEKFAEVFNAFLTQVQEIKN